MTAYFRRIPHTGIFRVAVVLCALGLMTLSVLQARAVAPGNPAFERTWMRTDKPVADGVVSRTWMWGPTANTSTIQEAYTDSPGGKRQVQYYDKARMEINDPSAPQDDLWYVTNGLLVRELITGKEQIGDLTFMIEQPANAINVAGDPDDSNAPTYGTFTNLLDAAPLADGSTITWRLAQDGSTTNDPSLAQYGVTAAHRVTVPEIDHEIASVFWDFMNSTGTVYQDGNFTTASLFENPFYATGYPLTEAYWATVKVAGIDKDVLMQCFERRCLTYTPENVDGWQVEAGNVGQHYFRWRYQGNPPAVTPTPPTETPTPTPTVESQLFVANLSGAQESPAVDSDASGTVYFYVHSDGSAIDYQLNVTNILNATMAHIHDASGAPIIPLWDGNGVSVSLSGVLAEGTLTASDLPDGTTIGEFADLLAAGTYSVNVHTNAHPTGEIRGSIGELPDTAFHADLSGPNENPPVTSTATGDANFLYHHDAGTVDFQLNAPGIHNATMAHIHRGQANENGAVLATLFSATAPVNGINNATGTLASDAVQNTDLAGLVYLMLTNHAYVNIHTSAHPDGEIRGQVQIGPGADTHGTYIALLDAANVDPPTLSAATGYAAAVWNTDGSLHYILMVAGLEDVTAAHLHHGASGSEGDIIIPLFTLSGTNPGVDNGILAQGTIPADDPDLATIAYWMATGQVYLDVHTIDNPSGEIRGELVSQPGGVFIADLSSDAEVGFPGEQPIESDASGVAMFWGNAAETQVSYVVIVSDADNVIQSVIQVGAAGEEGEVVATLVVADPPTELVSGVLAEGVLDEDSLQTVLASSTISDLIDMMESSEVYVNVHTLDHPDGEIRGQIGPLS